MEVRAIARQVQISPRKVRLVGNAVKGMPVGQAIASLQLVANKAGDPIAKALRSAVANAENNYNLATEDLVVARVVADEGRRMKRWRARARGRAGALIKRSCHITVVVMEREA